MQDWDFISKYIFFFSFSLGFLRFDVSLAIFVVMMSVFFVFLFYISLLFFSIFSYILLTSLKKRKKGDKQGIHIDGQCLFLS